MIKRKSTRRRHLVEALRSGEFEQGFGALESIGSDGVRRNCCLGVACRVAIKDGLEIEVLEDPATHFRGAPTGSAFTVFDGANGQLPQSVWEWYGFNTPDGRMTRAWHDSLIGANDRERLPLPEIADLIEQHTELFTDDA